MTNGDRLNRIEQLNHESAEQLREQAEQIRIETIELAYQAVGIHLEADRQARAQLEEADFPEGTPDRRYVLEDVVAAPFRYGEEPQATFSLLLMPASLSLSSGSLRVHLPVPEDADVSDYELPPVDEVPEIYLEYQSSRSNTPQRFVVNRHWLYEYTSGAEADNGSEEIGVLATTASEEILRRSQLQAGEEIVVAVKAKVDLTNMNAVQQHIGVIGNADFLNL